MFYKLNTKKKSREKKCLVSPSPMKGKKMEGTLQEGNSIAGVQEMWKVKDS